MEAAKEPNLGASKSTPRVVYKRERWVVILLAAAFLACAAGAVLQFRGLAEKKAYLSGHGVHVVGTVVDSSAKESPLPWYCLWAPKRPLASKYWIDVQYIAGGKQITTSFDSDNGAIQDFPVGSQIALYYSPKDPNEAELAGHNSDFEGENIPMWFAVLIPLAPILFWLSKLPAKKTLSGLRKHEPASR